MLQDKKVLITGCGGMLGNAVYPFFAYWYDDVLATDKDVNEEWLTYLDIRDHDEVARIFREYKPDIVLHLAAETDLEFCETHADITRAVNDIATKNIAKLSEQHGSLLVYISTAGVFDGKKTGFYTEEDQPRPIMVYGETKYAGEIHTLKYCSRSFVVRAGWMMGGGREKEKKFIYKILKQIGNGTKEIFAVNDKFGTPTYTYDFAMNLFLLINTERYGIYHMVCEGKGSRYDVAKEILRICNRPDIKLTSVTSDFFAEEYFVPRPYSEMLINSNLNRQDLNHMRPWQQALREYIETLFPDFIRHDEKTGQAVTPFPHEDTDIDMASEKRDYPRSRLFTTVEYTMADQAATGSDRGQKGVTLNISDGGLCLYTFHPVHPGQEIRFMDTGDPRIKSRTGEIRWSSHEKSGLYKAGLQLTG